MGWGWVGMEWLPRPSKPRVAPHMPMTLKSSGPTVLWPYVTALQPSGGGPPALHTNLLPHALGL